MAGSEERVRLHVHTNDPAGLFFELKDVGAIAQIKVDDMKKQYEAAWLPKSKTAFVIDSTCDLPPDWIDERQIHVIPCLVTFGDQLFLDKVTISAGSVSTACWKKAISGRKRPSRPSRPSRTPLPTWPAITSRSSS